VIRSGDFQEVGKATGHKAVVPIEYRFVLCKMLYYAMRTCALG
jgi:hypothetical protein